MQETGKTEEEIDKTLLWKKARELKTGGYESDVKMIVDKIVSFIDFVILDNLSHFFSNICPNFFKG